MIHYLHKYLKLMANSKDAEIVTKLDSSPSRGQNMSLEEQPPISLSGNNTEHKIEVKIEDDLHKNEVQSKNWIEETCPLLSSTYFKLAFIILFLIFNQMRFCFV